MVPKIEPTVAAVVVVFDPDDRFKQLLLSLVKQVNKIWIIDNQPNSVSYNYIKGGQFQQKNNIKLVENKKNVGLAAAQNQGIKLALEDGVDWILLLDVLMVGVCQHQLCKITFLNCHKLHQVIFRLPEQIHWMVFHSRIQFTSKVQA